MDGVLGAGLAGVVAGIGVAMPLGAIGVLLVQEAIAAGWRAAAAGALGVALVDFGYAAVAMLAGAAVTGVVDGHERAIQVGGALVLTAVVAVGMVNLLRAARQPLERTAVPLSPVRMTAKFVGLTAINPLTAVYFVALAAGSAESIHGARRASSFVGGVFVASLAWQLLLVTIGAVAGSRLGGRARVATSLLGYLVVLGYAVRLAAGAG